MTTESRRERWFRAWVGSWDALSAPLRWLLSSGLFLFVATLVVFVIAAWKLGWGPAFEVLAGYQSPGTTCAGEAATCTYRLAYTVAALGYVFVPAFIGAVAALVVDLGVRRHGPISARDVEAERRKILDER